MYTLMAGLYDLSHLIGAVTKLVYCSLHDLKIPYSNEFKLQHKNIRKSVI